MEQTWLFVVWLLGGSICMSLSHIVCLHFLGYGKDDGAYSISSLITGAFYVWIAIKLWPF